MIFLRFAEKLNTAVNGFLWGPFGLFVIIGTGVFFTYLLRGFQITRFKAWFFGTIKGFFSEKSDGVSPFCALCTALAATVGVGSIVGVASALVFGGTGALFWMTLASVFSAATAYAENVLGAKYATKNQKGERVGGPMYYLLLGLKSRFLSMAFALFTVVASFGIGNASQINAIVTNIQKSFPIKNLSEFNYSLILSVGLTVLLGLVILGGIKRIAAVTEKIVPFMVGGYLIFAAVFIFINRERIIPAIVSVFRHAFSIKAVGGGGIGTAIAWGVRRGVFSNEAGLGSTVIANCAAEHKTPQEQGFFGMFEVFIDTTVICTVTALCILCSPLADLENGRILSSSHATLVGDAFSVTFGSFGGFLVTAALCFFAFSTVVGWSYYGEKAWEFLFGTETTAVYKVVFISFITVGAVMTPTFVLSLSDTFNALMMLPNLTGVLLLWRQVLEK